MIGRNLLASNIGQNQKQFRKSQEDTLNLPKNDCNFQLVYKVNGHIKKIRNKNVNSIMTDIQTQISNYLSGYQQLLTLLNKDSQQNHLDQQLLRIPVLNINIKPFSKSNKNDTKLNNFTELQQQKLSQNIILLKEQIKCFQSPNDILSFIETQKNIALNLQEELTQLLMNSLKICWELLQKEKINNKIKFGAKQFQQLENLSLKKDIMLIKQNLDKIQDDCLQTLGKIKQERRKLQSCAICFSSKSNIILMPCMHLGTCSECSMMVTNCPFCKVLIQERKNIYQQ